MSRVGTAQTNKVTPDAKQQMPAGPQGLGTPAKPSDVSSSTSTHGARGAGDVHPPIDAGDGPTSARQTPTEQTSTEARARFASDTTAVQRQQALHGASGPAASHTAHGHADGSPVVTGGISGTQSARTFSSVADAQTALRNDFGVNARDGSRPWTAAQLTQAHQSFSRMNPAERANLRGTDLIRDRAPSAEMEAEHNHAHGEIAGYYSPNVTTQNGQRQNPAAIHMFDAAFPTGGTAAQNNAATQNVFLHEAGHAVEGQRRNDAMATANGAVDRLNTSVDATNAANDSRNGLIDGYNDAGRALGQVRVPRSDRAWGNYRSAANTANTRQQALYNAPNERARARAQTQLDQAIVSRDRAFGALPEDHPGRDAGATFNSEQDGVAAATSTYATSNAETRTRRAESNTANAALGRLQNAAGESTNLQAFKRMRARSGEQPVSAYGGSAPAEDYAEAYALYRRDPTHMQQNFPKTYRWFNQGNHTP